MSIGPEVVHDSEFVPGEGKIAGCVSGVADMCNYSCPWQGNLYSKSIASQYICRRADAAEFLARLAGKTLVCNCSLDDSDCWAGVLREAFFLWYPEAGRSVGVDSLSGTSGSAEELVPQHSRTADVLSSGLQTKRGKVVQLVPDGLEPTQHLQAALACRHPIVSTIPSTANVQNALLWSRMASAELNVRRRRAVEATVNLAKSTLMENDVIFQMIDPRTAVVLKSYAVKNVAFMREVSYVTGSDDQESALRLMTGLPMLGWAPVAEGLVPRVSPPGGNS